MIRKEDFFIEDNNLHKFTDKDYANIGMYIQFLEAVSRLTYKSIYVVDFFKKNFLHVSKNSLFLCGNTVEKVKEMGFDFYLQNVTEADLPLLFEINRIGYLFAESISPTNRLEYTLGYDFHMKQTTGKEILIHHEITPLHLTSDGKVWLALCMVSLSYNTKSGNIEVTRQGHNSRWRYHNVRKEWIESTKIELKDYEKNVLILSAKGYTMNDISKITHKSIDTIKGYKRVLFEKLGVGTITEAISLAIQHKLM